MCTRSVLSLTITFALCSLISSCCKHTASSPEVLACKQIFDNFCFLQVCTDVLRKHPTHCKLALLC